MARSAKKIEYAPAEQIGVIYARYSSHNQKEESIEQQIAECTEFAEKNGIRIIGIYADKEMCIRDSRPPTTIMRPLLKYFSTNSAVPRHATMSIKSVSRSAPCAA